MAYSISATDARDAQSGSTGFRQFLVSSNLVSPTSEEETKTDNSVISQLYMAEQLIHQETSQASGHQSAGRNNAFTLRLPACLPNLRLLPLPHPSWKAPTSLAILPGRDLHPPGAPILNLCVRTTLGDK